MANILPPKVVEPTRRSSVTLAERTWGRVDEIAEASGYSRDEVLQHFIDWACQEWTEDRAKKTKR